MSTHGKARETTISDLKAHKAFQRSGFAMSAVEGSVSSVGRLADKDPESAARYNAARAAGKIVYTVLSYATVIGWVEKDGTKVVPPARYSQTTTTHQGMLYLL